MADQISVAPQHNHQHATGAISSVEQLLFLDDDDGGRGNPLLDDVVNGMIEEMSGDANYGTNSPQFCSVHENAVSNQTAQFADIPPPPAFGNPMRVPVWPVPPSPYSCSCCQTLREIFHVNGSRVLKLGIHGRLWHISHAVLERFDSKSSPENHEYYMFDFCNESIGNVKQFLIQYCNDRKLEGFIMLQDPLSNFYDALCTGCFHHHQSLQGDGHEGEVSRLEEEANGVRLPKSYIASQRERAGKMRLRDLAKYFHLPINAAAKEMKLCPSAIKSVCRKEGLKRWPHRKIKSIKNEIAKMSKNINSADGSEKSRLAIEMQRLERELGAFYQEK
ncbi:uncharacterized protein LOC131015414 [Salvia miltiorrhiza]|uniref:uncharacterized protein LOC131015414 n=1 Tax=Salvia miltiorrhiza TaxID=226208 RepID=UPI0025AC8539|nr:uncharacterized protein LOC131015414 [Salvia miltiorrhiza]